MKFAIKVTGIPDLPWQHVEHLITWLYIYELIRRDVSMPILAATMCAYWSRVKFSVLVLSIRGGKGKRHLLFLLYNFCTQASPLSSRYRAMYTSYIGLVRNFWIQVCCIQIHSTFYNYKCCGWLPASIIHTAGHLSRYAHCAAAWILAICWYYVCEISVWGFEWYQWLRISFLNFSTLSFMNAAACDPHMHLADVRLWPCKKST